MSNNNNNNNNSLFTYSSSCNTIIDKPKTEAFLEKKIERMCLRDTVYRSVTTKVIS